MTEREEQLARVPFFDGLTREALSLIAQATTEESHATGTKLFQYGDPGDKLFIILDGKVRISREVAGMGEEALAVGRRARARALPHARHHQGGVRRSPLPAQGARLRGALELRAHPLGAPA